MATGGKPKVFLALPSYDGQRANSFAVVRAMNHIAYLQEMQSSALTFCFNRLWCDMLNMRAEGRISHFAMMHADVRPERGDFISVLLNEMEHFDADVMATIIAIKNRTGLTSTGIETLDPWRPQRLTMRQAMEMDETWTHDRLVWNTGLWVANVHPDRGDWPEKVIFEFRDAIVKDEDGKYHAEFEPEDWRVSRLIRKLGRTAYVTRKVPVKHFGTYEYENDKPWGEWDTDIQCGAQDPRDKEE